MKQTLKKGLVVLMALVMLICLLPANAITANAVEKVDAPVAGVAYKFGMIQKNKSETDVYYLKGGMDGYYMATSTDVNAAIDVYLEATTGGYYLYTTNGGTKTYINMVVSGTHVNGAYESKASTVYRYDATSKTLIADVGGKDYWFGTRNDKTYTTVGPCATSYNGFYCTFYQEAPAACAHTNTKVEGAKTADCTNPGHTGKTVCADCGATVKEGTVINAIGHNYANGVCTVCGASEPAGPSGSAANKADFDTIVPKTANGDSSYTNSYTTANGWITANSAIQTGGASVINPQFPVVGADNTHKAVCLNGKTSAPGSITSPTLTGGISRLTMSYTKMFTDEKLSVTITVTDLATGTAYTKTVARDVQKNDDKYVVWDYEWVLATPITGDFTIVIANDCPSALNSNKDRMTILELAWDGAVVPCTHANTKVDGAVDATCTVPGNTGKTVCADCGETISENKVIDALGHNEVIDAGKDATCTEAGKTEGKHCDRCNEVLVAQDEIAALGHVDADNDGLCDRCDVEPGDGGDHTAVLGMTVVMVVAMSALAVLVIGKKKLF